MEAERKSAAPVDSDVANQSPPPVAAPPRLPRALGAVMATAVVVGTVIGSGIFKKPATVAENVPNFGVAAVLWVLGGVLALLGALAIAEVAVLFPRAGGNYVFLREGYGRLFGFLWGWVDFWIIRCASIAALATIFTESLHDVVRVGTRLGGGEINLTFWAQRGITLSVIIGLALVNIRGVRWGGGLQVCITAVKMLSLLGILVLPFAYWGRAEGPAVDPSTLKPLPEFSLKLVGIAIIGIQWAYHGWMNIGPIAEEVKRPQRNLPLAVIGGVGIVIVLYLGANFAFHLVIPQVEMQTITERPVASVFCERLLGPVGVAFASGAIMFSTFGALNGNLLAGPRILFAMGQDNLVPKIVGSIHAHYHTPAYAIGAEAVWSCLLVVGVAAISGSSDFDMLTDFAMFGAVTFETIAVSTIFVFRRRLPDAERPYRCWGYPAVPLAYVLILSAVAINTFNSNPLESTCGVGFIALGAAAYFAIQRVQSRVKQVVSTDAVQPERRA
jgi:basic amino acid/polyamine antiporter, APA family